ncbi:hypothetical protein [Nonomuraea sp. JJY05]|uniref:hypothetical protein n=1 Tax=Nonomuraea sp. JJY05 TaxID=3350255 RepID=UPI00373F8734
MRHVAVPAALSTASAWSSVSALDGLPARPTGTSRSSTTFRLTTSRRTALRTGARQLREGVGGAIALDLDQRLTS